MSKEKDREEGIIKADVSGQVMGIALLTILVLVSLASGTLVMSYENSKITLNNYEVYGTFSEFYQGHAESLAEQYLSEGKPRKEAFDLAIKNTINQQYEDNKLFAEKYLIDSDWNGVYDSIENGEITQEEINQHIKEIGNYIEK